jgi:hypothetical protein
MGGYLTKDGHVDLERAQFILTVWLSRKMLSSAADDRPRNEETQMPNVESSTSRIEITIAILAAGTSPAMVAVEDPLTIRPQQTTA